MDWQLFLAITIFAVAQVVYARVIILLYHRRNRREQIKFVMWLRAQFPDAVLTFKAASGKSEHEAFLKLVENMQQGGQSVDEG